MKPSVIIVVLCMTGLAACKGSGPSVSPTSPTGSGTTAVTGAWTGTLTRPAGRGSVSLQWQVTVDGFTLKGPLTLTTAAGTVAIQAQGVTSGNDRSGYSIHLSMSSNSGDIPAFPTCKIGGFSASPDAFPSPYSTIVVATFEVTYTGCRGFINNGDPQNNFFSETVRIDLRK